MIAVTLCLWCHVGDFLITTSRLVGVWVDFLLRWISITGWPHKVLNVIPLNAWDWYSSRKDFLLEQSDVRAQCRNLVDIIITSLLHIICFLHNMNSGCGSVWLYLVIHVETINRFESKGSQSWPPRAEKQTRNSCGTWVWLVEICIPRFFQVSLFQVQHDLFRS